MQQLVLKIRESHYQLFLKFLHTLEYVKIVQPSTEPQPPTRYDFSDLAGKLEWKGDAVAQQRLMRDEW